MLHLLLKLDKIAMLASCIVICVVQMTRWGVCGGGFIDINKVKSNKKCRDATIGTSITTAICCFCCLVIAPKLSPKAMVAGAAGYAANSVGNYANSVPNYY